MSGEVSRGYGRTISCTRYKLERGGSDLSSDNGDGDGDENGSEGGNQ